MALHTPSLLTSTEICLVLTGEAINCRAFTKPNGMVVEGRKCGHPTCEYRNADRSRHMQEMHVREIATALCCPVCEHVFYDAGRDSEMRLHIRGHERGSALVRRRGREALMGCYSIDIPDDW